MWIFILTLFLALFSSCAFVQAKNFKRKKAVSQPFPEEWKKILEANVSIYSSLPENLKAELQRYIQIFLYEKEFLGCAGLEVTDEMMVTVAGSACVLLLNRNAKNYPGFSSVLLYPRAYVAKQVSSDGAAVVEHEQLRLGESWKRGPIVLAWDAAEHGAWDAKDGHNVILHEFAHKLDEEDGIMDGAPLIEQRSRYVSWARVLQPEFEKLQANAEAGRQTVMDHYGATNPAEFFAVLTETFFEKPKSLQRKHPELYAEVQQFYQVDPLSWVG